MLPEAIQRRFLVGRFLRPGGAASAASADADRRPRSAALLLPKRLRGLELFSTESAPDCSACHNELRAVIYLRKYVFFYLFQFSLSLFEPLLRLLRAYLSGLTNTFDFHFLFSRCLTHICPAYLLLRSGLHYRLSSLARLMNQRLSGGFERFSTKLH